MIINCCMFTHKIHFIIKSKAIQANHNSMWFIQDNLIILKDLIDLIIFQNSVTEVPKKPNYALITYL